MKGYKVFNPDWTCRNFQYEVGQVYEMDAKPKCCGIGFHFCEKAADCFNFYEFNSENKVAEVEALGDIDTDGVKSCTNKIKIVRELTWHEVLDLVNIGKDCTGIGNSGNCNSGSSNSGNWNSGNCNSGNCNSGNGNSGDCNSDNGNSGDSNSGNCNSGDCNSGDWNSGNWNSGDWNSGNRNSGNCNSGSSNSGNWNSGNCNSGNCNSGNGNSGDWNKASNSVGCFNTEDRPLFFFDKPTDMTFEQWRSSDACWLLNRIDLRPSDWIRFDEMSDEEKEQHPEAQTTGGYLKIRDNSDCCKEWWNGLSDNEKDIIKAIPNFDADKFFRITGIKIDD